MAKVQISIQDTVSMHNFSLAFWCLIFNMQCLLCTVWSRMWSLQNDPFLDDLRFCRSKINIFDARLPVLLIAFSNVPNWKAFKNAHSMGHAEVALKVKRLKPFNLLFWTALIEFSNISRLVLVWHQRISLRQKYRYGKNFEGPLS